MKIFFDANVLIAAFIARGVTSELFEHCLTEHTICTSKFVLDELHKNLVRRFGFSKAKANRVVKFIRKNAVVVDYALLSEPICRDPSDDHILAAAISGEVDCIISGDEDLLVLRNVHSIPILKPADFWRFEKEKIGG